MFTIEMLPAQRGDCLWLTYGEPGDLHHIIIDGGPQETIPTLVPTLEQRIAKLPGTQGRIELLMVSHVDADHIQGIVSLLSDHRRVRLFDDIWFNGFEHMTNLLGGPDGERLTAALNTDPGRWNKAFGGKAAAVSDDGPLPTYELRGGLQLTLLAPDRGALARLAPEWRTACEKAGIIAGKGAQIAKPSWRRSQLLGFDPDVEAERRYARDTSKPNGASIACIAQYKSKRVLLLGDAPAEAVIAGLRRIGPGPHAFSAVKMSHHGSRHNTSLALCEMIRSNKWLISTNGEVFGHPNPESIARVIVTQRKPQLALNYVTDLVDDVIRTAGDRYSVKLPRRRADGSFGQGVSISL